MHIKPFAATMALVSGATSLTLALHYPMLQALAGVLTLLCCVVTFKWPHWWLLGMPAALPVIGLAPWSGWITFEELDILILAIAAGGYARLAWSLPRSNALPVRGSHGQGRFVLWWLALGMFGVSTLLAMMRGFADAGDFTFGWFQGYHEPMNSVRLAKSFFAALLLLPLWKMAYRQNAERALKLLSAGLMLGLGGAALATVWERAAFTGLLNFSSDYRTTGMFWEMHVGGAALDGFLALTVPFAVRELMVARSPMRMGAAAAVCALAAYACLTTFSRGVYLAVPVGLLVFFVFTSRHGLLTVVRGDESKSRQGYKSWQSLLAVALLVAGFAAGAGWMFPSSGYRGTGALLGVMVLLLPLAGVLRAQPLRQWIAGGMGGLGLVLLAAGFAWLVPRGAYIAYGLAFAVTAAMMWTPRSRAASIPLARPLALAGYLATVTGVVLVAGHWGGAVAVMPAAISATGCLFLLAVATGMRKQPLWPEATRWQAGTLGLMGLVLAMIGIFGGGAYMGDRFSTGGRDLDHRLAHWKLGLGMLQSPADWWLGKGLGRFSPNHFLVGDPEEHPGDYRIKQEQGNNYLMLTGGLHMLGPGEMFRLMQRVRVPSGPATVRAKVRTDANAALLFEVCEKHLLYIGSCLTGEVAVKAAPGKWQTINVEMKGGVERGVWYAPNLLAFNMALETHGAKLDVDELALTGSDGQNLLANGDFSNETARWFFTSDKFHMPWHMKNMFLHVLFDQGIVGLALWSLLLGGAVLRLTVGKAKAHPLAPAMAASLIGFAVVGLFDSLIDVPRVATLFYLLVLLGLTLQPGGEPDEVAYPIGATASHTRARRPRARAREGAGGQPHKRWRLVLFAGSIAVSLAGLVVFFDDLWPTDLSRSPPAMWIREAKPWIDEHEWLSATLLPPLEWIQSVIEPLPTTEPRGVRGSVAGSAPTEKKGTVAVIQVGPEKAIKTIARAAGLARAGATIEVDAGEYVGDVAVWTQDNLTLRAVGGRVKLIASGSSAEGKGIWVIRGGQVTIDGFDFVGARVADHNGAGIRFEQGFLRVRDCTFTHNENGILASNQPDAQLEIENSEFGYNGYGDGLSHNLYVGEIARLSVTGSYFHHAKAGHLLKSRAENNHIFYNRLTDEIGGSASYELDLANGGVAYLVGNIIQQGSQTKHRRIISYGSEGSRWPKNELYLANNTVIDNRPSGGVFLHIRPPGVKVMAVNNLLVGQGKLDDAAPGDYRNNFTVEWKEFELAAREDYRLKPASSLVGKEVDPGSVDGVNLQPLAEYLHPRATRALSGKPRNPGALQSMLPSGGK